MSASGTQADIGLRNRVGVEGVAFSVGAASLVAGTRARELIERAKDIPAEHSRHMLDRQRTADSLVPVAIERGVTVCCSTRHASSFVD